jgi:hypothetical protein
LDPSLQSVIDGFLSEREKNLFNRLNGWIRAVIVETNDPQRMGRVRFKMPELHNIDINVEDCPWAVPAPALGGQGAGSWVSPCIGDQIFVTFEKNHLYGPIWASAADAQRRKLYPLPSVSGKTPLAVSGRGEIDESPDDFDEDYHPKDNRPMSHGLHDRYGHTDIFSAVGFFPKEHAKKPAPAGVDGVTQNEFEVSENAPEANKPDVKYAARISKYGVYALHSDVGYKWDQEFDGEFEADEQFEVDRWKYFLKLLNEEEPEDFDQRRYEVRTRYGHKFEMRDVGWNKSRAGEYKGEQINIGDSERDERFIKLRTKAGHFFQMIDTGADSEQDQFIKRLLKSEVGSKTEEEDQLGRDRRMIRLQTRYGFKQVLDDRGSDSKDADNKETPRGNGWFVKGRRDNRGFFVGFNERDEANHFIATSPTGQTLELNDRFEYVGLSTKTSEPMSVERNGHYGVEWVDNQLIGRDYEYTTYHVKLDKKNKYTRMKNPTGQGVEFRDRGGDGGCRPWAEIRDEDDRGIWWNTDGGYAIWRSRNSEQYMVLHDASDYILIRNTTGKVQIIAQGDVEVKSDQNINLQGKKISLRADNEICLEAAGNQAVLNSTQLGTLKNFSCRDMDGKHNVIRIPLHPNGPAPQAPVGCGTAVVSPTEPGEKKPRDEDQDRACAPNKIGAGPVPSLNFGGGGGPGGDVPGTPSTPPDNTPPPDPSPNEPQNPSADPPPDFEPPTPDPLPNGCLWYGISDEFRNEIEQVGLQIDSFSNLQNIPETEENPTMPGRFIFSSDIDVARGEDFAVLAQKRYGGFSMILKIRGIDEPDKLSVVEDSDGLLYEYLGEEVHPEQIEIFEIGKELLIP